MGKSLFTDKEVEWLVSRLQRIWDEVGHDMFRDDQGNYDPSIVIPRDEVYEIAADRLAEFDQPLSIFERLVVTKFYQSPMDHVEKMAIKVKAFPYPRYGV